MKVRVISGIVIGVLCVVFGLLGGAPLGVLLLCCAMIACHEMYRACSSSSGAGGGEGRAAEGTGTAPSVQTGYRTPEVLSLAAAAAYYAALVVMHAAGRDLCHGAVPAVLCLAGLFLALMTVYVLTFPKYRAGEVSAAVFSFVYAPLMMSFIFLARTLPYGRFVYALIFFSSWICDTFAYFSGRLFGRHKMAPVLSPKKTIEGAVGGAAGSTLVCFITGIVAEAVYPGARVRLAFALIGLAGSVISMIGDLAASAVKRDHGIKDYGSVIPGHGGIMDRFDSVIFTAPVIYLLAALMIREL